MKKKRLKGIPLGTFFLKLLRLMKVTLFLLCVSVFSVMATESYSQATRLSVEMKNAEIKDVLEEIENQSEFYFFYSEDVIDAERKVSVDFRNSDIEQILKNIFEGTNVEYKIVDRQVALFKGEVSNVPLNEMQQRTVTGKVTGSDGQPIPGATVAVKGTTNGTITDFDGIYKLANVPADAVLMFRFVGMRSQEVPVSGLSVIDVVMQNESIGLDEIVAVGYGVQKKSDLTGSISQVKSEDLENRTIVRPEQALQGKTAGVQIINTSGAPAAGATVRIRGFSSNTASDPLYVVDGLRTDNIGFLDPNNIESMEVLKDAASAAIYGAEAGNGVILITTKRGKKGAGTISYDVQYTFNSLARIPDVLNAEEYVNYMTEANYITHNELSSLWDGVTNTDWTDVAFETSVRQKHNISFQGANDRGAYNLSLSYLDDNGIVKGDKDVYERWTGMINADYKIKDWIKVGTTNSLERWKSKSVSENSEYGSLLAAVLTMDPLTPAYYDADNLPAYMQNLADAGKKLLRAEDGRYYGISQIYQSYQTHPLIMRDRTDPDMEGFSMLGTVYADLTPVKNLVITSKLGYRASYGSNYTFDKIYYASDVAKNDQINVSRTNYNSFYYQWENFANYLYEKGDHSLTTMAGISYSSPYSTTVTAAGNQIVKDDPLYRDLDYLADGANRTVSGGYSNARRQFSYFGRFTYNYAGKYMLQASVRRDASDISILPAENRWGTFPAVSAGYTISKEDFFPENTPIDHLKLRASWGQNGSTGPLGGFSYRAAIVPAGSYPYTNDPNYQVASAPTTLSNNELSWETSEQLDFGLDLRAFDDRLTFGFDYFDKKTKDLLVAITPPFETGVSSTSVNAGNVKNSGLEFELGWTDKIGDFSYSVRGNLATLKNKVTYLDPSISRINGASLAQERGITVFEQGFPIWYMRGYELADIDDATGDPVFVDQLTVDTDNDGVADQADGTINSDDKVMLGSGIPDFTYGLTLTAAYKGFDLTVFGTGSSGNDIFNALTRIDRPRGNKLSVFYDDRWTPENAGASKPRPNANGEDKYWISSDAVMDGSFFKVKQMQLGYTLPESLLRRSKIQSVRLYVSLDDWIVISDYPGFDPEASAGASENLGVDKGAYPTSRKSVFGLNITF